MRAGVERADLHQRPPAKGWQNLAVAQQSSRDPDSFSRGAGSEACRHDLARVEELTVEGRDVEAVDLLATINGATGGPLRRSGWWTSALEQPWATWRAGRSPWPPVYPDPFPGCDRQICEVGAQQLTTDILAGTVAHHGCIVVRGVFSEPQAASIVDLIERVHRSRESGHTNSECGGDFAEGALYRPLPGAQPRDRSLRRRVADRGGIWLADSPAATAQVIDWLAETNVIESVRGHFGERPFFSLQKSTLRRSQPVRKVTSWHQDGSFLDSSVRTMNLWVALSDCGGAQATPALEVVPKRVPEVLPVDNVMHNFAISFDLVAELTLDAPTVIPQFAPGDALMFDERFVHRTHLPQGMTRTRYALECWMFAPSHQSPNYTPLLI